MEQSSLPRVPSITSPSPSYRSLLSENEHSPPWAREVAASLPSRQRVSRASSIISTRTKVSTSTALEEARSIDLNIGGFNFRINRDGSRITTSDFRDPLPRYSPTVDVEGVNGAWSGDGQGQNIRNDRLRSKLSQHSSHHSSAEHPSGPQNSSARAMADTGLSRSPSFIRGKETISVAKKRAVSQNDVSSVAVIPRQPIGAMSPLRRRNGVRLPTLLTNLTTGDQRPGTLASSHPAPDSASPRCRYPRSADPTLGNDNHSFVQRPRSPVFIGRGSPELLTSPPMAPPSALPPPLLEDQPTVVASSPAIVEEGYAETYPPPPMESENDISLHYTRLIRTIDRDHRKALHERDKEMATLRERLNEQDTIYRQQLRGRDLIIEDLKSRLAHLETTTAVIVEKACGSVEDLWEKRWKERDFHLMERMRRMEVDLQAAVRSVAAQDKMWTPRVGNEVQAVDTAVGSRGSGNSG